MWRNVSRNDNLYRVEGKWRSLPPPETVEAWPEYCTAVQWYRGGGSEAAFDNAFNSQRMAAREVRWQLATLGEQHKGVVSRRTTLDEQQEFFLHGSAKDSSCGGGQPWRKNSPQPLGPRSIHTVAVFAGTLQANLKDLRLMTRRIREALVVLGGERMPSSRGSERRPPAGDVGTVVPLHGAAVRELLSEALALESVLLAGVRGFVG